MLNMSKTITDQKTVDPSEIITIPIDHVYLYASIIFDGRNETSIHKQKIPTIQEMGWTKDGLFFIRARDSLQWLHGAVIKQTFRYL